MVALLSLLALLGTAVAAESLPDPVTFGGSASYPPFQWLDDRGEAHGFVVDLGNAMTAPAERAARHRLGEWNDAIDALRTGRVDVVALFPSRRREADFDFSQPFYYVAHGIFAMPEQGAPARLDDLPGHRVAVVSDSYAANRIATEIDGVRLVRRTDIGAAIAAVEAGAAAVAVVAADTARQLAASTDSGVQQISAPFWPRPYVFAVREGNDEMLSWIDERLAIMQADGTYHDIFSEWRSELVWHRPTLTGQLWSVAWIVLPLTALVVLGCAWSWTRRRLVRWRTSELRTELERSRQLEDELQHRVEHDPVTELPNREAFVERLGTLMERDGKSSPMLATIHVVNLERITITFSYRLAYELLHAMARRLHELDFLLVGHFGAGTFAIAFDRTLLPEELLRRVTVPLEFESMVIDPQVVAGMAEDRPRGETGQAAEELLRRSGTALASAHARGHAWQAYAADMEPDPADLLLLRDFNRHGTRDMFLVMQPKVELATGRVQGAEALVRWRHPEIGLISPARFVPLLEQCGLISRVTKWVVEYGVQAGNRLRARDLAFTVSINIAPRDLIELDLQSTIANAGDGHDPAALRLEITETGFIQDARQARRVLSHLRSTGIHCAVDDFGTGYSSLSYLSEFPISEVKIDRSFVADMLSNERHFVIVRSTIALAHELGMTVTAEGAEDVHTLDALAKIGCDAVQGYAISKPVAEAGIEDMIDEGFDFAALVQATK